ncbi:MAG: hypothetical protein JSW68_07610 [Burkholderiales bacterium]|nr:MAG: hypothetical protein JSW68_07610 [Burkholderiales bacterium]
MTDVRDEQPAGRRSSWREPYLWLVLAAPVVAVIAGLTTVVIAYRGADQIVQDPPAASRAESMSLRPAVAARNQAAAAASGDERR